MSGKVKIGSVVACVVVIWMCHIYYTEHISSAIYNLRWHSVVKVEDCRARITDEAPEGYYVNYYGSEEDLAEMEVVEITWLLSNKTNGIVYIDDFRADYDGVNGFYPYKMRKETEDLVVSDYDNRKIIPSGEQATFKEYLLVRKDMHEIEVTPGNMVMPTGEAEETFTLTF